VPDRRDTTYGMSASFATMLPPSLGLILLNQRRFNDRDALIGTAAHELFHLIQFAVRPQGDYESGAMLGAEEVVASKTRYFSYAIPSHIMTPQYTLGVAPVARDFSDDATWVAASLRRYGAYSFLRFLDEDVAAERDDFARYLPVTPGTLSSNAFYQSAIWNRYRRRMPDTFVDYAA